MGGATMHAVLLSFLLSSYELIYTILVFTEINITCSVLYACVCERQGKKQKAQTCSISDLESGVGAWHSHQAQYGLSAAPHTLPNSIQPHPHRQSLDATPSPSLTPTLTPPRTT